MPINCGVCLKSFKSYLRLQSHMSDAHGMKNRASKWTDYNQKEALTRAEENLKKVISSFNSKR